jgi:predicted AAA+ superfamily ATPase
MFPRSINYPKNQSFFLLGPRGTGKSTWIRETFKDQIYFDLLDEALFHDLLREPGRFSARLTAALANSGAKFVVIDEIQRLPDLLNEVHRWIETTELKFILTGSSARKLRRQGTNLLAGRARQMRMHPLTAEELGTDFDLLKSIKTGHLPTAYITDDPARYLSSYVGAYLKEEIQQEALVRNLGKFSRFLEAAAFSQASVLNVNSVSQDCGVDRKTAENYFQILEDLLIGIRISVFQRRAKRSLVSHQKFFFFDTGVFRALRKRGPLDSSEEIEGAAIETIVFQELLAVNDNHALGYEISYWRTKGQQEVDFILYGPRGLYAIEVKRSSEFRERDLAGLRLFRSDYPEAKGLFLYGGTVDYAYEGIRVVGMDKALRQLLLLISGDEPES